MGARLAQFQHSTVQTEPLVMEEVPPSPELDWPDLANPVTPHAVHLPVLAGPALEVLREQSARRGDLLNDFDFDARRLRGQ